MSAEAVYEDIDAPESTPSAFGLRGLAPRRKDLDVSAYSMTPTHPRWLPFARSKLEELGRLPRDWDGYGSGPVTAIARAAAYNLLRRMTATNTPAPTIVPAHDGTVQIEWHLEGVDLEVRVLSPTRMHVYLVDEQGQLPEVEEELRYDLRVLDQAIREISNR